MIVKHLQSQRGARRCNALDQMHITGVLFLQIHRETEKSRFVWVGVLFGVGIAMAIVFVGYRKLRSPREDGYAPIVI